MSRINLSELKETDVDHPRSVIPRKDPRDNYHTTFRGLTFQQDYLTSPSFSSSSSLPLSPDSTDKPDSRHLTGSKPATRKYKPVAPVLPPTELSPISDPLQQSSPRIVEPESYTLPPTYFHESLSVTPMIQSNRVMNESEGYSHESLGISPPIQRNNSPYVDESYHSRRLSYSKNDGERSTSNQRNDLPHSTDYLNYSETNPPGNGHMIDHANTDRGHSEGLGNLQDEQESYARELKRLSQTSFRRHQPFQSQNSLSGHPNGTASLGEKPDDFMNRSGLINTSLRSSSFQSSFPVGSPADQPRQRDSGRSASRLSNIPSPVNQSFHGESPHSNRVPKPSRSFHGSSTTSRQFSTGHSVSVNDDPYRRENYPPLTDNSYKPHQLNSSCTENIHDGLNMSKSSNFPINGLYNVDPRSITYSDDVNYPYAPPSLPYRPDSSFRGSMDQRMSKVSTLVDQVFYPDEGDVILKNLESTPSLRRQEGQRTPRPVSNRDSVASFTNREVGLQLEATSIKHLLYQGFVYLTGGVDRQGGPVLTFPMTNVQTEILMPDIILCLNFMRKIPSLDSLRHKFTVIIDKRDEDWKTLLPVLVAIERSVMESVKQIICVIKGPNPDHVILSNIQRELGHTEIEPMFVQLSDLPAFISLQELTGDLGGDFAYSHHQWVDRTLEVEKFMYAVQQLMPRLSDAELTVVEQIRGTDVMNPQALLFNSHAQRIGVISDSSDVVEQGQSLLLRLKTEAGALMNEQSPHTSLIEYNDDHQRQVSSMLNSLEVKVAKLNEYFDERELSLQINLDLSELEQGAKKVVDWILGPGEKLLSSQVDIGDTKDSAEELRKRHEEIELKCTKNYAQYAELRHQSEEMIAENHPAIDDITSHRDYMDTVCRSFASRLQRRRLLVTTSLRFHRTCETFTEKIDALLASFQADVDVPDIETAESFLAILQEKCDVLNSMSNEIQDIGQTLLDELTLPIKDSSGRDITLPNEKVIGGICEKIEDLLERKARCDELSAVRRLKLQQILQLRVCERDVDQAIRWLAELTENMLNSQEEIGRNAAEAKDLQHRHDTLAVTATRAYNYGRQLLDASLILRRSLNYDLQPNYDRVGDLEALWRRFDIAAQEKSNRFTVSIMFRESVDRLLSDINQLKSLLKQNLATGQSPNGIRRNNGGYYERIMADHRDTDEMGRMLCDRLARPLLAHDMFYTKTTDGSSEIVSQQLKALKHRIVDLNGVWYNLDHLTPLSDSSSRTNSFNDTQLRGLNENGGQEGVLWRQNNDPNYYTNDRRDRNTDDDKIYQNENFQEFAPTLMEFQPEYYQGQNYTPDYLPESRQTFLDSTHGYPDSGQYASELPPRFEQDQHTYANTPTMLSNYDSEQVHPPLSDEKPDIPPRVPITDMLIPDSPMYIPIYPVQNDQDQPQIVDSDLNNEPVYAMIKNGVINDNPEIVNLDILSQTNISIEDDLNKNDENYSYFPEMTIDGKSPTKRSLFNEDHIEPEDLEAQERVNESDGIEHKSKDYEIMDEVEETPQNLNISSEHLKGILKKPVYFQSVDINEDYSLQKRKFGSLTDSSIDGLYQEQRLDFDDEISFLVSESDEPDEMKVLERVLKEESNGLLDVAEETALGEEL